MSDSAGSPATGGTDLANVDGSNVYLNGLIGGVVGVVLFFVPFSTILGGAVAGYLEGTETDDGAKAGLIAGLVMFVPAVLVGGLFLGAVGVALPPFVEPWVLFGGVLFAGLLYVVALGVLGGMVGSYLKGDAIAAGSIVGTGRTRASGAGRSAAATTGDRNDVEGTGVSSDSPGAASDRAEPGGTDRPTRERDDVTEPGLAADRTTRSTVGEGQASNTLMNGVIGGVAVIVLSFVPFSPILGGGIAGYLERGTYRDGAKVGLIAGLVVFLPLAGLALLVVPLGGLFVGPETFVPLFFIFFGMFFFAAYFVGLTILGGVLGIYVREEMD